MITSSLEDYLEYIYNAAQSDKTLKAIDIAKHFNVSRASVSEALIRLSDKNLITYEGRKGVTLTTEGLYEAKRVINKHNILCNFLNNVLGFNQDVASKNACKIEHVIDDEVISKIDMFNEFCINEGLNIKFNDRYKND